MQTKEIYMRRALELASLAEGYTAPNPMVGAVIVDDKSGLIISEGYHHKAGQPHAEVMAVRGAGARDLSKDVTMYVSLEPCSHYGKTPPCSELIINKGIKRVVVAMQDPFLKVAGRGIKMLRDAGVEVQVGMLEAEAQRLNHAFLTAITQNRPYITLKWAETSDGFIDKIRSYEEAPLVISTPIRRRIVHKMRSQHDGIMVGGETLRKDNPSLDNRFWLGHSPRPIIVSHHANIPLSAKCLQNAEAKPILFCSKDAPNLDKLTEFLDIKTYDSNKASLDFIMETLIEEGVHSLLVEGGSNLLQQFLNAKLYDKIEKEVSSIVIGTGIEAPQLQSPPISL
ncbi:bifunctional diaminohydroxyphosphoribosylaminopyrimidine deaminase/5-amino-6-(5-phosphoribosylamino)uracil reductase RibD [Falsiporphyromonas endometrii]|uniref:Riboflavin biosynthesis protein RibD n=1 Tax=Falsiporphyromonas endometrii TaxID=1387297 RepID=A0ABV9K7R2_9PORP